MTPEEIAALPYRPNVGLMIVNRAGRVWMGHRIDGPAEAWQMPQGGIDQGEDVHKAGLRELEEETGITADKVELITTSEGWLRYDLPADLVAKLWKGRWRGQEQKWLLLRYLGEDSQINIDTKHPEFDAWEWVDLDQVAARIVPFKRDVYASVLAELGPKIG